MPGLLSEMQQHFINTIHEMRQTEKGDWIIFTDIWLFRSTISRKCARLPGTASCGCVLFHGDWNRTGAIARNFRVLQNAIPFHLMKTENDSFAVQSESVRLATREYRMNPAIPPLPVFVGIFHPGKGNRHLIRTTAGQNQNTGKAANPVPYPGRCFGSPTGPGNGNRQKCCPTCQPNRFPMRYRKS